MARTSGTVQPPLSESDFKYADMLLEYSRVLGVQKTKEIPLWSLEKFENWYWKRERSIQNGKVLSSPP
jgi:hypothetical protein